MKKTGLKQQEKQGAYGRPRLLTNEEILDGAIELGLEGLTMKKLASHLNVGTATLYQYFDSRKALMRAAAVHSLADVSMPCDNGQHWTDLARDYTFAIQNLLAENPSFIYSHQHSDYGFEVHFRLVEPFLEALQARGFDAQQGMDVFNIVGMASFAGAIETVRQREFEYNDETMAQVARRQFDRLDAADFPRLSEAFHKFIQTPEQKVEALLRAGFVSIAQSRGEDVQTIFAAQEDRI